MAQLAGKIAASVSPSAPVTLETRNISSLNAAYAAAVQLAFETELRRHSFQFSSADSPASQSSIQLHLTLSESVDQFVWAVQTPSTSADAKSNATTIVSVPKTDLSDGETDQPFLSLEKHLVWKQSEKFLDFALTKESASNDPALLILETNQLALYKMAGSQWQISRADPLPQAVPPGRDPQGKINIKEGSVSIADQECVGDPNLAGNVHCKKMTHSTSITDRSKFPGLPATVATPLPGTCGNNNAIYLATGEGDWTTSDLLQGYLEGTLPEPMITSGTPIKFDGPVMSLTSESDTLAARAIVHNLKTGNYEAYIVTATCSH